MTARDGQFTFLNVPAGAQDVGLDLNALPVDFDAPSASSVVLELSRGETKRVAFALVPLVGSVVVSLKTPIGTGRPTQANGDSTARC